MAKRRRRGRGTGSVIAVRQIGRPPSLNGLGKVGKPGSFLGQAVPVIAGGGLAGAATLLVEHMGKPAVDGTPANDTMVSLAENAELVGGGVGLLGAAAMYALVGAPAALSAAVSAIMVGGTMYAIKSLQKSEVTATTVPNPVATKGLGRYRRHMGAIVAERMPAGMGAIVLQPAATNGLGDPRGETVSLGAVNPGAFGTPGFNV